MTSPASSSALVVVWLLAAAVTGACGQKGPPLPPLRPLPVAPTDLAARRVDDRVQLRLVVPSASQDPAAPVSVSRVEIYARTVGYGSEVPVVAQVVQPDFLVGTIDVRPVPPPDAPPPDPDAPVDSRPAPGDTVTWSETVPAGVGRPLELTREQQATQQARRPIALRLPPSALAVPFVRMTLPTRYYVAVAISERGRPGAVSSMVPVRFGGAPPVPATPTLTYDETTLTLTWTSPEGAHARVYAASPEGREEPGPVQAAPITTGSWSVPVVFGEQRCYTVRHVQVDGPVSTESAAAGPVCATPVDSFPPAVPVGLLGASEPGRVTLQWDAVAAADLAGYHVLRGTGPGATLQPLTTALVEGTGFVDLTAQPGVEYVYVVVAVDRAGNRSAPSAPRALAGK